MLENFDAMEDDIKKAIEEEKEKIKEEEEQQKEFQLRKKEKIYKERVEMLKMENAFWRKHLQEKDYWDTNESTPL